MAYFGNEPAKVAVKVGSGVITATELADDSITTADIIDDAITPNQLDEDGTGFQVGTLGIGAAVSGGHALLVNGTSSISGAATFSGTLYAQGSGSASNRLEFIADTMKSIGSNLVFATDGGTTLTLTRNDNNATFAGNVTVGSGSVDQYIDLKKGNSDKHGIIRFYRESALEWGIGHSSGESGDAYEIGGGQNFGIWYGSSPSYAMYFDTSKNATFAGNITMPDSLIHTGDTDTMVRFGDDEVHLRTGGGAGLYVRNSEVEVYRVTTKLSNANAQLWVGEGDGASDIYMSKGDTGDEVRFSKNLAGNLDILTNGGVIHLNVDGKCGIGTGSPSEQLHISTTGASTALQIHSGTGSSTTGVSQIYFSSKDQYGGNTHQSYIKSTIDGSSSTPSTKMSFHNRDSSGTVQEYLTIKANGKFVLGNISDSTAFDVECTGSNDNYFNFRKTTDGGGNASLNIIGRRENSNSDVSAVYFKNIFSGTERLIASIIANTTDSNGLSGYLRFRTSNGGTSSDALILAHDQSAEFSGNITGPSAFRLIASDTVYLQSTQNSTKAVCFDGYNFRPDSSAGDNVHDCGTSNRRWNDIYATNSSIQTSDKNQKKEIKNSSLGLGFLNLLTPREYKWKGGTRKHYGLVAQEVEKVLNDNNIDSKDFAPFIKFVNGDTEKDGYGFRYGEMVGILIKAVQELSTEVEKLKGN